MWKSSRFELIKIGVRWMPGAQRNEKMLVKWSKPFKIIAEIFRKEISYNALLFMWEKIKKVNVLS